MPRAPGPRPPARREAPLHRATALPATAALPAALASGRDPAVPQAPSGSTLVARLGGDTPGSTAPGAAADQTVPGSWYGYPSLLPVIAEEPGWLEVRLAQRPNQSTAWVPAAAVTLTSTAYRLELDLSARRLIVYLGGRQVGDFPAGIGTSDDPTVTGHYFVTMDAPPPDPGYGPFVVVTSAHSDAISDFEESGDAIIAIHGPIDAYDDGLIGTSGAAISHGCVRLHDADLAQLSAVPPGTPLDVYDGSRA